ncbi:hypothetical protein ACFRU3_33055 [Streptomyces sp. NPDC056910]|uniref:hypothetical protein n=1 Tax=Streptomyces sp. NPDC056910 TaxID=3345964 RepID=UPI0036ADEAA0
MRAFGRRTSTVTRSGRPLLRAASALGCPGLHGGGMVVHQAAASFRLFTKLEPRASHMLADFADLAYQAGDRVRGSLVR